MATTSPSSWTREARPSCLDQAGSLLLQRPAADHHEPGGGMLAGDVVERCQHHIRGLLRLPGGRRSRRRNHPGAMPSRCGPVAGRKIDRIDAIGDDVQLAGIDPQVIAGMVGFVVRNVNDRIGAAGQPAFDSAVEGLLPAGQLAVLRGERRWAV